MLASGARRGKPSSSATARRSVRKRQLLTISSVAADASSEPAASRPARCLSVVVAMVLLGAAGAAGCCWVLRAKTVCVCRYSGKAGARTGLYDLCAQLVAFATTCRLVLSNVMPSEALCLLVGMLMQVDSLTPHALADVCSAIACMQGYHH